MRLGWLEILLIVVLIFLLFGANKFPSMMKNLADGLKVFKKEIKSSEKKKTAEKSAKTLGKKRKPAVKK